MHLYLFAKQDLAVWNRIAGNACTKYSFDLVLILNQLRQACCFGSHKLV